MEGGGGGERAGGGVSSGSSSPRPQHVDEEPGTEHTRQAAATARAQALEKKRSELSLLLASFTQGSEAEGGDFGGDGSGSGNGGDTHATEPSAPAGDRSAWEARSDSSGGGSSTTSASGSASARNSRSRLGVVTYCYQGSSGAGSPNSVHSGNSGGSNNNSNNGSGDGGAGPMVHVAAILADGAAVCDSASGARFESVIQWMESKENKPHHEEVNYSSMAMNLNDWGDSDSDSSSSEDDDDDDYDGGGGRAGRRGSSGSSSSSDDDDHTATTTHAVSVTTIYSSAGHELATVTGNNVVRLTANSTWMDFKDKLRTLARNVLRLRVPRVSVFRAAPEDALGAEIGTEIVRLDQLGETDTVYVSVPEQAADPNGTVDDESYSDDDGSDSGSGGSGTGSGSDAGSDDEQCRTAFDADVFAQFQNPDGGAGFSGFSLEAAAAAAAVPQPGAGGDVPAVAVAGAGGDNDDALLTTEDEWGAPATASALSPAVAASVSASAVPVGGDSGGPRSSRGRGRAGNGGGGDGDGDDHDGEHDLPRTASDMDTLALLAMEVDATKSPRRRKGANRAKGVALFSEVDADARSPPGSNRLSSPMSSSPTRRGRSGSVNSTGSGSSGGGLARSRSRSHSRGNSVDFDALGIGNLDLQELGMEESPDGIALHASRRGSNGGGGTGGGRAVAAAAGVSRGAAMGGGSGDVPLDEAERAARAAAAAEAEEDPMLVASASGSSSDGSSAASSSDEGDEEADAEGEEEAPWVQFDV